MNELYKELIIERYKSGDATLDIANSLKLKRWSVAKIISNAGIQLMPNRYHKNYTPHNKQQHILDVDIRTLHSRGLSTSDIAKELKCSKTLIRQRLQSFGLNFNSFHFPIATNLKSQIGELAFKMLNDRDWLYEQYVNLNKTTRVLAAELHCGKKAISTFLKRYNIPIKRTRRGIFKSKYHKCKHFWYDSYWEFEIAERLDSDSKVLWFIKDPFPLPYCDESGKDRDYYPDFLVIIRNNILHLLEVKPTGLLKYVEFKTKAGKASSIHYTVISNVDKFPW